MSCIYNSRSHKNAVEAVLHSTVMAFSMTLSTSLVSNLDLMLVETCDCNKQATSFYVSVTDVRKGKKNIHC